MCWAATAFGRPKINSDNCSDDKCGIIPFLRFVPEPRVVRGTDEFLPCPLSCPWLRQFPSNPCLPRSAAGTQCAAFREDVRPRSKSRRFVPAIVLELPEIARGRESRAPRRPAAEPSNSPVSRIEGAGCARDRESDSARSASAKCAGCIPRETAHELDRREENSPGLRS